MLFGVTIHGELNFYGEEGLAMDKFDWFHAVGADTATRLYCVFGNPVAHSKSPLVHNMAFRNHGINAVYLAFSPADIGSAVEAVRTLSIAGVSVTLPFKESVMTFLDNIDTTAKKMGAVNTIVNRDGVLHGCNTDTRAVVDPLRPFGIVGKKVLVLGAGGAARAAAFGVSDEGGKVFVTNRTDQRGRELAQSVGGTFVEKKELPDLKPDMVINTTSVGMQPNEDATPFPEEYLLSGMVVMDAVYTPVDTMLLRTARKKGCHVVDGVTMFVAQAAAQFYLWTGIIPDTSAMRSAVLKEGKS